MLYLQTLDKMLENLILTEIWIVDSKVNKFNLPQNNIFTKCNNSCQAGVAVFIAKGLLCHMFPEIGING